MSDDTDIGHDANNNGGRYWANIEGGSAELGYHYNQDGAMVIDHLYAPEGRKHQRIAERLVRRAAEDAHALQIKIIVNCAFADRIFKSQSDLKALRSG